MLDRGREHKPEICPITEKLLIVFLINQDLTHALVLDFRDNNIYNHSTSLVRIDETIEETEEFYQKDRDYLSRIDRNRTPTQILVPEITIQQVISDYLKTHSSQKRDGRFTAEIGGFPNVNSLLTSQKWSSLRFTIDATESPQFVSSLNDNLETLLEQEIDAIRQLSFN